MRRFHSGSAQTGPVRPHSGVTAAARIVAVAAYSALIIYLGTRRNLSFPGDEILSFDKLVHAVAFGGVGLLAYRCFSYFWPKMPSRVSILVSVGFASSLGATLELIQATLPYRSMEPMDLAADIAGASLCTVLAKQLRLERPLFGWGL